MNSVPDGMTPESRRQLAPALALAVAASVALAFADSSIVVLALPQLLLELDTTVVGVSWVITAAQMAMKVNFSGVVDGDRISGKAEIGSFGEAAFEGVRA